MNKLLIALCLIGMAGCAAKPYEATSTIYDPNFTSKKPDTTNIRVHRAKQITGAGLGDDCPLVLKVDQEEVAGLQQNQYIDLHLQPGRHTLSVRFKCAVTEWRKSVELEANGFYQEYETETGAAGQYRIWRTK